MDISIQGIYDSVPGCIFKFRNDTSYTVVYANTQFYKFIGYSKKQFIDIYDGKLINLVHEEDKHKLSNLRLSRIQTSSCDIRISCADKSIKWVLFKNKYLNDNNRFYLGELSDITDNKNFEHKLGIVNDEMQGIFNIVQGGVLSCNLDSGLTVIDVSYGFYKYFGINEATLEKKYKNQFKNLIYKEDIQDFLDVLINKCKEEGKASKQLRVVNNYGEIKWIWLDCVAKEDLDGKINLYISFLDITTQKKYKEELELEKKRYEIIFSQAQDVVYEWNCKDKKIYYSENYEKKFGYNPVQTSFPQSVLDSKLIHTEDANHFWHYFVNISNGIEKPPIECRILKSDGEYLWCQVSAKGVEDCEGNVQKVIGMICDIDNQKQKVLKAQELAKRDPLTGLYNHGATEEKISQYLKEFDNFAAIMVIDVDNFKSINDSQGHIYGDAVLTEIAYRLKTLFRKNDVIGRFGGDEFVVFLSEIDEEYDIERRAKEVLGVFSSYFLNEDFNYKITSSIGIAKYPRDGSTYTEIFKKADLALYYAKNNGKNTYAIYNKYMDNSRLEGANITTIKNDRVTSNKAYRDNIGEYIFRIFYDNPNVEEAIRILLELVGKSMNASRVYIFEYNDNQKHFINTFEWCNNGVESMKNKLPIFYANEDIVYSGKIKKEDLFYCKDVNKLQDEKIKEWLQIRNTKTTMICKIYDEDKTAAIVGFEQCERTTANIQQENEAISLLSNMISLFLIKKRKNETLKLHKAMSKKLLDHIKAFFYVIDPSNYKILYFDKNGNSRIPDTSVGGICYNVFRNSEKPCKDCPMFGITKDKPYSISYIYNSDIEMWTENHASIIQWKNGQEVCLISSIDITKYKKEETVDKEEAKKVYYNTMYAYLVERNVQKMLYYLDDNIHSIGSGFHEIALNKEQLRKLVEQEINADPSSYSFELRDTVVDISSDSTAVLYTIVKAKRKSLNGETIEVDIRETATLIKVHGQYKISSIHASIAAVEQEDTEFYPIKVGEKTIAQIWEDEKIRNYRFLDSAVPGGMMSAYLKKSFPIICINDRMLEYLGYTDNYDFIKVTNGLMINCVHLEDREKVEKHIWSSLAEKDSYEIIYRMLRKDGSYIWVCEKGKRVINDGMQAVLCVCLDITSTKEAERELMDNSSRFGVVVEQTNICVWDYNIKTKQIINTNSCENRYSIKKDIIRNVPDSIINSNRIHKDSIKELINIFDRIGKGEKTQTAEICFWDNTENCWCWEQVTYRTIFNDDGEPIKAIGIGQNITKQKEAEIKFKKELKIMNSLTEGVVATCRINVTKNLVEYVQSIENQADVDRFTTGDELVGYIQKFVVNTEEKEKVNALFKNTNLLKLQIEGKKSVSLEFRRQDAKGNIIWVCANVNLSIDKQTEAIYAFATLRDINESKKLELSLKQRVEKDSVTGVYNRETAILIIRDAMKRLYTKDVNNVMVLITVENYKEIMLKSGEKATNKMLCEISKILGFKFGKIQIIGRIYSDSFILLIGGHTKMWVEQAANKVVQLLKTPYFFADINVSVIVSVGIAQQSKKIENFEKLYLKASLALQIASSKGKNKCVVYNDDLDCSNISNSTLATLQDVNKVCLKEQDTLLLSCAVAMVSMEDIASGINKTLKDISNHYSAPHVFVVELNKLFENSIEIYEFNREGNKCNLKDNNNLALKNAFNDWVYKLKEDGAIIANDKDSINILYNNCFGYNSNYCVESVVAVPLNAYGRVLGFICVENLNACKEDLSLLSSISAFISSHLLKKQLFSNQEFLEKHDMLTGLFNRDSYTDYRISITEDVLSSLGVAIVDINGFKKINNQYGFIYGDNILKFVAEKLKHYFEDISIYRLGDDEFVVISQNTTKESFERKCKRFISEVKQTSTAGISVGYVWSDRDINLDNMMKHADERMMIAKMEYYKDTKSLNRHHNPSVLKALFTALKKQEFKMYLQPKADIHTRSIASAEALVRLYKEERGIIFPDKFIPQMEEDGTIKYLDLFMFEEVCKTIHKWIESGVKPITISLNFSRNTLLATDLIDSMSLIYQKYNVPKELIEIEITESFGEMERETIVQIVYKIVEMGFRLSLDDFGSKYSNISILSAIKLDALKLDKSIVNDLFSNNNTRIVVKNFLCICRELGIESVAEGVETEEQLDILRDLGCDMAQGYLFNKPIPLGDFEQKYLSYELV